MDNSQNDVFVNDGHWNNLLSRNGYSIYARGCIHDLVIVEEKTGKMIPSVSITDEFKRSRLKIMYILNYLGNRGK